jgi:hypothetical protein
MGGTWRFTYFPTEIYIYIYIFCVTITYINGWSMEIIEGDCHKLNFEDEIEKFQGEN